MLQSCVCELCCYRVCFTGALRRLDALGSLDERDLRNAKEEYSSLANAVWKIQRSRKRLEWKKTALMRAIAETPITEQIMQVDTARIKLKWALPVTVHNCSKAITHRLCTRKKIKKLNTLHTNKMKSVWEHSAHPEFRLPQPRCLQFYRCSGRWRVLFVSWWALGLQQLLIPIARWWLISDSYLQVLRCDSPVFGVMGWKTGEWRLVHS